MPTELWLALIGVVGGLLTGLAGAFWTPLVKSRFDRRQSAAEIRNKYSPPLLQSAFDLQSRFYNIVREGFLRGYYDSPDVDKHAYAEYSTLWLIGQYFGWVEILRREAQFLDFGTRRKNRALQDALLTVAAAFASDRLAAPPAIFRTTQRALGELMITPAVEQSSESGARCLGYAEFTERLEKGELRWFDPLRRDIATLAQERQHARLVAVQRALIGLIDALDPTHSRFPNRDLRGRLPQAETAQAGVDDCPSVARFSARASEYGQVDEGFPDLLLETWSREHKLQKAPTMSLGELAFQRRLGVLRSQLHIHTDYDGRTLQIRAGARSAGWLQPLPLVHSASRSLESGAGRLPVTRRRGRKMINDLLERFDRPPLI
jgi:hypothetical protein